MSEMGLVELRLTYFFLLFSVFSAKGSWKLFAQRKTRLAMAAKKEKMKRSCQHIWQSTSVERTNTSASFLYLAA